MKKILMVTSEFKISGPNNVISNLINALIKNSEVTIRLTSLRKNTSPESFAYLKKISLDKNEIFPCNSSFSLIHLFKIIKLYKPTVVNSHGLRADIFVFLLSFLFRYKHVATVHNIPNEDYFMRYGPLIGRIMLCIHMVIFRSRRVLKIAVSRYAMINLISLGAKNVNYIYNGIDKNYLPPSTQSIPQQLSSKKKKVIYCGHLSKIKDPLTLARTASINKDIELVFLGSGELYKSIDELQYKNIVLTGRVDDVASYLAHADLFVMSSISEGMPMALIEAMFFGLPIVCSDIPIFKEVVSLGVSKIELFKVGNHIELAEKIRIAIGTSGEDNIKLAEKHFSSTVMANKYLEVFNG